MNLTEMIAAKVRALRKWRGWSQSTLAAKAGLSKESIDRLERGAREPRLDIVTRIADAIGVPLPALLRSEEDPPRPRTERMRAMERSLDLADPWLTRALLHSLEPMVTSRMDSPPVRRRRGGRKAAKAGGKK